MIEPMIEPVLQPIKVGDGVEIVARFFSPDQPAKAAVLIVSGTGIKQDFYQGFAYWLARQGYLAVTFDFRGIGRSAPASLRGYAADMLDWAQKDAATMVDVMRGRWPDLSLVWIGHSLGGQILGLLPNAGQVDAMITVATGSGYWRENAPRLKRFAWWLWYFAAPVSVAVAGYFPGKRLRKVGDLPEPAMKQWTRWCKHPDYLVGAEGEDVRQAFARLTTPILSLSFTDDEYMSARNTAAMHAFYASAPREMRRIAPQSIGVKRIGHFGFFRSDFADTLWPLVPKWIVTTLA